MICCLNPNCQNPPHPDSLIFCQSCGTKLVLLRNHYRPIQPLGGGGFSKTYLAEDIDKLNERCVIKQFAPQVQESKSLHKAKELFEQEAIRLQQLGEHPQIPKLLAYSEQDNHLYLVQQYIPGQTLGQELAQQGPFSEPKIWELLFDLLDILKFIHQQGVIHRDIKPENIIRRTPPPAAPLVTNAGRGRGEFVLIDFGIAKQLTATVLAQTGTTIGSFGYVPIEQMQDGKAYRASDLYSLGATCFHLLTGVHPWELWKKQGYGWVFSWRQHLKQPISQQLWWIMDRLLPENPQQRYQSVEKVLESLNSLLSPPPPVESAKPKAQLKNTFLVGGTILLLGVGGTQLQGYFDYRVFHSNQIFLIGSLPSSTFLKKTLTGHTDAVFSLAISKDGQTLVTGSGDKTIKIWNLSTGELKNSVIGHTDAVFSLVITPDGETLVTGSGDKTIKIWDLSTGRLKNTLTGHTDLVISCAMTPDGKTLVTGSGDKTIKIWNLSTGQLKNTLTGHTNGVSTLAITPDGQTLVSGSVDNSIKIWNLSTGELKNTLIGHMDKVFSLAMTPDGQTLVSGSGDKTIKIWNLSTGQLTNTLTSHTDVVTSCFMTPDGQTLVTGSGDNSIKTWNWKTGELKTTLTGHTNWVSTLAMTPNGQMLVSGSGDNSIKIWQVPR
jgi:WD40 repeat protein/tRNA A-37 threonylcarbamoyl transferase component Bud32